MVNLIANMRIGSKLMLVFGLLILAFGGLFFLSLQSFSQLQSRVVASFQHHTELAANIDELRLSIMDQRIRLLLAISRSGASEHENEFSQLGSFSEHNSQLLDRLRNGLRDDPAALAIFEQLQAMRDAYATTRDNETIPLIREGRLEEARALFSGVQARRMESIHELGQQLATVGERGTQLALERAKEEMAALRDRAMLLGIGLLILCIVFAQLLSKHIAAPLARLTAWSERISSGDIPDEMIELRRQDEVGRLGAAFTRMGSYLRELAGKAEMLAHGRLLEEPRVFSERDVLGNAFAAMARNLREMVQELNESIAVVASASEEILAVTTQVASSTQETATAISEIATTVEEVKQTAVLAGNKSQSVGESTERTRQVARDGLQSVEETLRGMGLIREQMQAVAESVMRLGEQSQTIGEIVATVGDLAEQSNLLGVNASIEAVKAGEAGKGFSVVAQEVKTLADQSKQATAQVRGILGDIQKAMTRAVMQAEEGSKSVEGGYQRAQLSGEAIRILGSSVEESSEIALQIAASSQQQMIGMDQIGSAMENIRQASQDNVAGARQVDLAARNLHQLGLKLKGLAARFEV